MKAVLVSKRFNPGHLSHIIANAKLLSHQGFATRFSVNKRYSITPGSPVKGLEATFNDIAKLGKGDLYIVWFPSLSAFFELFFVKVFTSCTTVYVYHEPFTSFASYLDSGFSWVKTFRVFAISLVSRGICFFTDKIILPSERAYSYLAKSNYSAYRFSRLNLMFTDEAEHLTSLQSRKYISYIGTIAEDHAFNEFASLMSECICNNACLPFDFLIATRSKVPIIYQPLIDKCLSSGRLFLHCGTPMTNRKINCFYGQSFVIWNAYKRSMQSGVLPKAYMFGTPVLVSSDNISEYFQDGVHGLIIPGSCNATQFQEAITTLLQSWTLMSINCRSYYLQNFDVRALESKFMNFVFDKS